jgi:hypothetical protein
MKTLAENSIGADRLLVGGTAVLLVICPLLASTPEAWPGLVALSFVAFAGILWLWKRDPLTREQVLLGALLLRLAFLPLSPGLTDDLYRYVWDGWLQVSGINPYRFAPKHEALAPFQTSPLYQQLNSQPYYSVYPPLTQLPFAVSGWIYTMMGWHAAYYVLKGLFLAAEFCGVLLLSRLTTPRNLLLYAWNPLVLIETAGQGHTEALLVPFIVGLIWAVQHGSGRWASFAVAGAGMIKLYPFVLGPFLIRRHGWSAVWPGALLVFGLSLPYAAPYVLPHLKSSVDLFAELFEFNAGPYYMTKYVFWLFTGADWSKQIGPTFRYLFLVLLPILYALDWWRNWSIRWATLLTIGLFLGFSTTVHPWYLLPVLALGVMHDRPSWPWLWLGMFSIGTYLFYTGGTYWIWVTLGWGGAALLGLWLYARPLRNYVKKSQKPPPGQSGKETLLQRLQADSR